MADKEGLEEHVPESCQQLLQKTNTELRSAIPTLARDWERMMEIENKVKNLPTDHRFHKHDSRKLATKRDAGNQIIEDDSIHLVLTSPPYFNIKDYDTDRSQLGTIDGYDEFLNELKSVWKGCFQKLVPGGRMCIVTGDILQSRRENGRHRVLPLHSKIQEHCRDIGFDCLAPIIWYKIGNASLEAGGNARFLGKPYEPGAVVKNDIEYILMFRKPGGYRSPSVAERILSTIQVDYHKKYFQQVWTDIDGEKRRDHPAPYPPELAERLIRMFSFVGDTVMDSFAGIGSTAVAASRIGRNSVNIEINEEYHAITQERLSEDDPTRKLDKTRLSDFESA